MSSPRRESAFTRREFLERATELGIGATLISGCIPRVGQAGGEISLSNDTILGTWSVADNTLRTLALSDHRRRLDVGDAAFVLTFADGTTLPSTSFGIVRGPAVDRRDGQRLTVTLEDRPGRLRALWSAVLGKDARYIRQELVLTALSEPQAIREISLIDVREPGVAVTER